ncbi:MAG: hypothetical protein ACKV2U_26670 [Bryobacteraceae bacterium]
MVPEHRGSNSVDEPIRYWQSIATHIGVSVRTPQRYARDFSLPVRRMQGGRTGSSVYAMREELDDWLRSDNARQASAAPVEIAPSAEIRVESEAPPTPAGRRSSLYLYAAGGILAAGLIAGMMWTRIRTDEPAAWRIENSAVVVSGASGKELWRREFPGGVVADVPAFWFAKPAFHALDGDGRKQLLFQAWQTGSPGEEGFYCFDPDGSVRFRYRPGAIQKTPIIFGDADYAERITPNNFAVVDEPGGGKSILLTVDAAEWFPTAILRLDSHGGRLAEFWHPGHILNSQVIEFGGRRLLFAGGTNNEFRSASVAVMSYPDIDGHAPATKFAFSCRTCPPRPPLHYFVFPDMDLTRIAGLRSSVISVRRESSSEITFGVLHGTYAGNSILYTFATDFRLKGVTVSDNYRMEHQKAFHAGKLKHPYGAQEEREARRVRRFNGSAFEEITMDR